MHPAVAPQTTGPSLPRSMRSQETGEDVVLVMTAKVPGPPRQSRPADDDLPTIPASGMPNRSPLELLILARHGLAEATSEPHDGLRYAGAHLAALRAAAAVLAVRARPDTRRRGRVTNVWQLLTQVAPELREWAEFFAVAASKRAAAQAGIPDAVTTREADDLLRDSEHFVNVVTDLLNLSLPG